MSDSQMAKQEAKYVVATDVGGTCTDTIVFAEGEPLHLGKALSTPPNFAEGVLNSIANAAAAMGTTNRQLFAQTSMFMHEVFDLLPHVYGVGASLKIKTISQPVLFWSLLASLKSRGLASIMPSCP